MGRGRLGAALVGAFVAVMSLGACDPEPSSPALTPHEPVSTPTAENARVIGLVGTMSGDDGWRGEDAFEGAHLAVNVLNRGIDEGRPTYELVTLDDQGDPARAARLVADLALNEHTVGVVYAGPPQGLPPAERALHQAGIPAVLCYGDLYAARLLRPHIFQASPSLLWEARAIARYVLDDRGYRRIGLLASRSITGDTAVAALKAALTEVGQFRLVVTRYTDESESNQLTRRFAKARVDAVVVEGDPELFSGVSQISGDPQMIGFDLTMRAGSSLPAGSVVSDTYARGVHYLPIPSFEKFRTAFREWWDGEDPLGWEQRAYDATLMIGWAAKRTPPGEDGARVLETLSGTRFGGLDITFGPDDHTAVDQTAVGLWVRPRAAFEDLIPTNDLPWLPLARGFSIDGDRTAINSQDWRHLFRNPPPPDGPAPKVPRMRYAVSSRASDPLH